MSTKKCGKKNAKKVTGFGLNSRKSLRKAKSLLRYFRAFWVQSGIAVYDALYSHQMTEDRFHNDESSWKVFESIDGKVGNRWWLWVSRSASVVFFQIAPGRGADVPIEHFENIQHQKIIVVCDRYSAYKSMARQLDFIILAFCWAHVRRDFLDAGKKYPNLEEWALSWVEKIGELYHINNLRCKEFGLNRNWVVN